MSIYWLSNKDCSYSVTIFVTLLSLIYSVITDLAAQNLIWLEETEVHMKLYLLLLFKTFILLWLLLLLL